MNGLYKFIVPLIIFYSSILDIAAHEPNEITYEIEKKNIRIRLTPKSIIDLIDYLNPENSKAQIFKISDFDCLLENYFNNKIEIVDRGNQIYLAYSKSNLISHDAYLDFILTRSLNNKSELIIKIQAFHKIYPVVTEQVFVNGSRWY